MYLRWRHIIHQDVLISSGEMTSDTFDVEDNHTMFSLSLSLLFWRNSIDYITSILCMSSHLSDYLVNFLCIALHLVVIYLNDNGYLWKASERRITYTTWDDATFRFKVTLISQQRIVQPSKLRVEFPIFTCLCNWLQSCMHHPRCFIEALQFLHADFG